MTWHIFVLKWSEFGNSLGSYLSAVAPMAATAAVLISIISIILTRKYNRRQVDYSDLTATLSFLNEWREPEFKEKQAHVQTEVKRKVSEDSNFVAKGYNGLDTGDKRAVEAVSFFFDYVGNIISAGHLNKRLLFTVLARPIMDHWYVLSPLLERERNIRSKDANATVRRRFPKYEERYQAGFEHLAEEARRFSAKRALKLRKYDFSKPR